MNMTISVAESYSPFVMGRFPTDSRYNGEEFRELHLMPALKRLLKNHNETLTIDINGTFSPDPSFLEEAFGGAVRKLKLMGVDSSHLWKNQVTIVDDDKSQKNEILGYISDELRD